MNLYRYKAMSSKGMEVDGVARGRNEDEAIKFIKGKSLFPIKLSILSESTSDNSDADADESSDSDDSSESEVSGDADEPVKKTIDLGWFRLRIRIQIWMEKKNENGKVSKNSRT